MNRVELIGRLARDAELKVLPSGTSISKFTIATDKFTKGEEKSVDFIPCVAWKKTADFIGKYGKRGDLISVEGRVYVGSYEDTSTHKKVNKIEITADSVEILNRAKGKEPEQKQEYSEQDTGPTVGITSDDLPF